jgi:endonuclease YncB( thermonuclease family)
MRPLRTAAALAAFAGLCVLVVLAGAPLSGGDDPAASPAATDRSATSPDAGPPEPQTGSTETERTAAVPAPSSSADPSPAPSSVEPAPSGPASIIARPVSPEIVAPPPLDPATLDRVAPREPLSQLALALPPKPLTPDKWNGKPLFRPLADAAGRFSANGFSVAIAGVEPVEPDETCGEGEGQWPCGMRARTAFRQWLRGRALSCTLPEDGDPKLVVASCRLGKQDAGEWLAANGWAPAVPGGPYAEAGRVAREKGLGIFGGPPRAIDFTGSTSLPPSPLPQVEMPAGVLEPLPAEAESEAADGTPG